MDKATWQYRMLGRYKAKSLFPIPLDAVCFDCDVIATDHHHIDGNTYNNIASNVIFLCRRCHLRREREAHRVGNRSKLTTAQIKRIKYGRESISKLSAEFGYNPTYLRRIRKGIKNPKPADTYVELSVPAGWRWKDRRGKPRALSTDQVKQLRSHQPHLGRVRAKEYATKFGVAYATIWKAYSGHGCYSDAMYS